MTGRGGPRSAAPPAPVVLAVTATPLLNETLAAALDGVAVLRHIPAGIADLAGLVRHIDPDALMVDDEGATDLAVVAAELSLPLVHVSLRTRELRVLRHGGWRAFPSWGASPNAIRNVLIGEIYGSDARRRERAGEESQ